MKAKGLEISGTFSRRAGVIQMEMTLTNKAMSVMTDFAIQFNKNRWENAGKVMGYKIVECHTCNFFFLYLSSVASVLVPLVLFRFLLL